MSRFSHPLPFRPARALRLPRLLLPLRLIFPLSAVLLLATACTFIPTGGGHAEPMGKGRKPLTATFLGNSTLLIDDGTDQILIDGFLTRPGAIPAAVTRLSTHEPTVDAALDRAGANRLKAVFVTHSHYDHALDAAYVIRRSKRIQKQGAILHGSASTLNIGRGGELDERDMALFQTCRPIQAGKFHVTVIPSRHTRTIPLINDDLGKNISQPLRQPARKGDYAEGGSYDFLIRHQGGQAILVKPSANYQPGALDSTKADVLFLGVSGLGRMSAEERDDLYRNTVTRVNARRVIPIHWDNFFCPLSENLPILFPLDRKGLQYLEQRLTTEGRRYELMQGYERITIR